MSDKVPQSILYVGAKTGTSLQRAEALRRLGYNIVHVTPYLHLPRYWAAWLQRTGGLGIDNLVSQSLRRQIGDRQFDFAHVDSGEVIGIKSLKVIRQVAARVSNYNPDNPYSDPPPERHRWNIFRKAVPLYDLCVAPKREAYDSKMLKLGAKNAQLVWFCADELLHKRPEFSKLNACAPTYGVVFVGTWMTGRDAFLLELIERGVPVDIFGSRWNRGPYYAQLKSHIRSDYLRDLAYRDVIASAKVALVLLNGANLDLHTTRSTEIPAIGTAMCAPRTKHHLELYNEDTEVVLFDDAKDCADKCLRLLADEALRNSLARAGHERTFHNSTYNQTLMTSIIEALAALPVPNTD